MNRDGSFLGLFVVLSSSYRPPSITQWPEVYMSDFLRKAALGLSADKMKLILTNAFEKLK